MIDTIIFDYDGTLHDSSKIYIPAFKKAYQYLVENRLAEQTQWKNEEITQWLGYDKKQMWSTFMPALDENEQKKASDIIGREMLKSILKGKAELYEHSIEILDYLKSKDYQLIFLSNCSINYMELHKKTFKLNQYFSKMICSEQYDYKKSKKEIVKNYMKENSARYMMVGDRFQDIEVGQLESIYTVGCNYGYGKASELDMADIKIEDISDLFQYF